MWRILLISLLLAGCSTLPPHPMESEAKQFRPVPDKAVVYLYRERLDFGTVPTPVSFDGVNSVTTYPGTFYRWVTSQGQHRLQGFGGDTGAIDLNVEAGKVYFVQHSTWWAPTSLSSFRLVSEQIGRDGVSRAEFIEGL